MENDFKEEIKDIISKMEIDSYGKANPSKYECKKINELRNKIDGVYSEDCFCGRSSRKAFLSDILDWLK
jgi:hypothetical protein